MRIPFRKGLCSSFWTFRHEGATTNAAEIDIVETFSGEYKYSNIINTCIHKCYPSVTPNCVSNYGVKHDLPNFDYSDFRTYALEWDANRMIWYVDGKAIRTLANHKIVDPVRIILNLAIQSESKYYPPPTGSWSEYMNVDYVKVYSLKCDKNTVVNEISNFNTYNYAVKKSITLSGATTIPAGSNITLRANDFIELKAGFEVPIGRELYLDVSPCTKVIEKEFSE
jgi:beta-glucanase (GH16 family)